MKKRLLLVLLCLCMIGTLFSTTANATYVTYGNGDWSNGWTWWSQGQSKYADMRGYGCYVVAKAKMLVDAGIETTDTNQFNPDILYEWELANGYIVNMYAQDHAEPAIYASRKGKTLNYEGIITWFDQAKIWDNINSGKYTILCIPADADGD